MTFWITALSIFLLAGPVSAQVLTQEQVENKVKSDLQSTLDKVLEEGTYSLQVSANIEKVSERQLVEGEQIISQASSKKIEVPPLPGFNPEPPLPVETNPGQTRQVYHMVDKPVLRGLVVNLLLDQQLPEDRARMVEDLTRSYLSSTYPNNSRLNVQHLALRKPLEKSWLSALNGGSWNLVTLAVMLAMGLLLGWLLLRIQRTLKLSEQAREHGPAMRMVGPLSELGPSGEHGEMARGNRAENPWPLLPPAAPTAAANREKASFSGVPTNSQYADSRRSLLDAFLQNAGEFRLYFKRLDPVAQSELYSALSGPALSTLLESLKLEFTADETVPPPTEEQLQFYLKNFSEFQEALRWQEKQFFGFLSRLNEEQLYSLVQSQSPVVAALILKFAGAQASASVLDSLGEKSRADIIDQFERTREMSPSELNEIEASVREAVRSLPNFILGSTRKELEYWENILLECPDPQKLLNSLESARPDLYQHLAKFRFKLEDMASLPPSLLRRVLEDFENDDLARALSTQPSPLVGYALTEVSDARRKLLESQIQTYQNVCNDDIDKSVHQLTKRFQEVLA